MSTLTQFTGGGSVIKSIQRGSWGFTSGESETILIATVDPGKSTLNVSVKSATSGKDGSSVSFESASMAGGRIDASGGSLFVSSGISPFHNTYSSTRSGTLYWEVIEYV